MVILLEYPPITTISHYGFITDIAVGKPYRRGGIGRRLFEAAEHWLLSHGVPQIEVKVDGRNTVSRAFWSAAGFQPHTQTLIKKYPESG